MFSKSVALSSVCLASLLLLASASWGANKLFGAAHEYKSGGVYADSATLADVNGDRNLDLLVTNGCSDPDNCQNGGLVGVLLGNSDGTFQPVYTYGSGGEFAISIAVADVNGDGKLDLLVVNNCASDCASSKGAVGVLLGNGDGTFQTALSYSSGGYGALSMALGDVNGDGKADLLVANGCGDLQTCHKGSVGLLLGNADGTFQEAQVYDSGSYNPHSLAVADVNKDGKLDLLVASTCLTDTSCQNGGVAGVLLGNGDGTLQAAQNYNSGGTFAFSIAVDDVNGDGKPDLAVANWCRSGSDCNNPVGGGVVGVLLGNGNGTFQKAQRYSSGGFEPQAVVMRDVNGDGKLDLLVTNAFKSYTHLDQGGVIAVHLGNGDGTFFGEFQRFSSGGGTRAMSVGDVNGDGKPDLAVANGDGIGVLLGVFSTTTSLSSSLNPSSYGQSVTFTATVTTDGPSAPEGTVTFKNGSKWLGKATLSDGVATLTTTHLPVGTLSITARYNGTSNSAKSTSEILIQVVH